jgi:hypothetical protein
VNKKNLSSQPALRDQLLIASAKTITVLHLRQNSLISTLLLNKPAQQVYYLKVKPQTTTPTKLNPIIPFGTSPLPAWFTQQNYLGHWTRDCDGPWPGETRQQWINQLLDGLPHANHSALNTLRRIIQSKTLTGTGNTIHGQQPMACFTRVPITQWAGNHVYRPHLQRWDFGPHGLLIKREWLQTQGLLPVFYGTQQQCDTLSTNDRRYFQINEGSIDWRTEQEERVVGDLDLHGALSSDIIFFTQHQADAEQLQSVCRWLVLSVGELCHDKLANSNIAEHQIRGTL